MGRVSDVIGVTDSPPTTLPLPFLFTLSLSLHFGSVWHQAAAGRVGLCYFETNLYGDKCFKQQDIHALDSEIEPKHSIDHKNCLNVF